MIGWLLGVAWAGAPAQLPGLETVRDDWIRVECTELQGQPWCRSQATLDAPIDRIEAILLDTAHYPQVFKRIESVETLAPLRFHITLDMPYPLADRDYVAQYTRETQGEDIVFSWVAADDPAAPPREGTVRLAHTAGEWRLRPDGARTVVRYTWMAELGGDMPDWARPRAYLTWGSEIMEWLDEAR